MTETDDRFARHSLIPGWRQERLAAASVVVVGVGALGNEVARLLAMAGVGRLILCDPDRVDVSNLSRTALFRQKDVGALKVAAAAAALADLAPETQVVVRPRPHVHGVGLAELRDASLVVSCLDGRAARIQLSGRCMAVGAPCLDGGTNPWGGEVRPFFDPDGPCYACALTPAQRATTDTPWSCLDVPETAPVAAAIPSSALIGSWMGLIAVRRLLGQDTPTETLVIDGAAGAVRRVATRRDPNCLCHDRVSTARKLPFGPEVSVADLLGADDPDAALILWEPVADTRRRHRPGCAAADNEPPCSLVCPECGAFIGLNSGLEISLDWGAEKLSALGVPPGEILAIRRRNRIEWVELAGNPTQFEEKGGAHA